MKVVHYNMSREEFERYLSVAMSVTIETLVADKILDSEKAAAFLDAHTVVVLSKASITSRLAELFGFKDDDTASIRIANVRHPNQDENTRAQ